MPQSDTVARDPNELADILSAIAAGLIVQDADGKIEMCNAGAERILGLAPGEKPGTGLADRRWRSIKEDGSPFAADADPAAVCLRSGRSVADVVIGLHRADGLLRWISVSSQPRLRDGKLRGVVTTFTDVTARFQDNQERRRLVPEDWNIETGEGFEIGGSWADWADRIHPDDRDAVLAAVQRHMNGEIPFFEAEYRLKCKDGSWKWVLARGAVVVRNANGKALRFMGTHTDVTERHNAQEAQREAERQYRVTFEEALEGIFRTTPEGRLLTANPALARILGYSSAEEIVATVTDMGQQVWRNATGRVQLQQALEQDGVVRGLEAEFLRKDGSHIWVSVNGYRVAGPNGETVCYQGFIDDISARRNTEDRLQSSEARYRDLFTNSLDAVFLTNTDGSIRAANPAACRMLGMSEEEICRMGRDGIVDQNDPRLRQALERRRLTGQATTELTYIRKDGSRLEAELISATANDDGESYVIARDISERKLAEQALQNSEEKFAKVFASNPLPMVIYRLEDGPRFVDANAAFEETTGYHREELIGRSIEELGLWTNPAQWEEATRLVALNGELHDFEHQFRRKSGETGTASVSIECIEIGGVRHLVGSALDITGRKRAEEAVRESEALFSSIFQNAPVMLGLTDPETGRFTAVNDETTRRMGYRREEIIGRTAKELGWLTPEERVRVMATATHGGKIQGLEISLRAKGGSTMECLYSCELITVGGKQQVLSITQDITERKKATEALRAAEDNLQSLIESTTDIIWSMDANHRLATFNRAFRDHVMRTYGTVPEIGARVEELIPPARTDFWYSMVERAMTEGPQRMEDHLADGRIFDVAINPIFRGDKPAGFSVFGKDITDRIRAQEVSRRYEFLSRTSRDIFLIIDPADGSILEANTAAEHAYGFTAEELMRMSIYDVRAGLRPEQLAAHLAQASSGGLLFETVHRRKDGSTFPVEVSSQGGMVGGKPVLVSAIRDITERKQAEAALGEAARLNQHMLDSAQEGIIVYGPDLRYVVFNRFMEALSGIPAADVLGRHPAEVFPFLRDAGLIDKLERVLAGGQPEEIDFPFSLPNGRTGWSSDLSSPLRNEAGDIIGVIATVRDTTEKKQAEETLRKSDEKFAKFFRANPTALNVATLHNNPKLIEVNDAFQRIFGYSREECLGRSPLDLWADKKDRAQAVAQLQTDGFIRNLEARFRRKQGNTFVGRLSAELIELQGEPCILSATQDISEEKQLADEREITLKVLRLSNSTSNLQGFIQEVTSVLQTWSGCEAVGVRLRDGDDFPYFETRGFPVEFVALESSLCSKDVDGQLKRDPGGNPVLECMCGNILCGRFDPRKPYFTEYGSFHTGSISRLLGSTTEADRQPPSRNRCSGEGYETVVLIPVRAQGQTFGLLQFNDRRPEQLGPGRVAILERIAANLAVAMAQKRAVQSLRDSETRYRELFNGMTEGFAHCRIIFEEGRACDFVYLDVNEAFHKLTGLSNVIGRRVSELIPGIRESDPELLETYGRVAMGAPPERFEVFLKALGMWLSISVHSPAREHFVAVFAVVTERKQAEEERDKMQAQLAQAQKMESVGRLAGGVAHDFNNLLTIINGYSEMALADLNPSDPLHEQLREISKAGERATSLTRQLLAFSRKQILQPCMLDLNAVVGGVQSMLRRLVGEDVELRMTLSPQQLTVHADPHQLEQVIMNLVVNSRDAMPRGGQLHITTGLVEHDSTQVRSHPEAHPGRYAVLGVTDNGTGMDAATLQRVFEPFFTTKEMGRGTGLGLSTVQGIVVQSGGHIEVDSEVNRGTTFRVYLPAKEAVAVVTEKRTETNRLRGRETVLVVEDQTEVRNFTVAVLKAYGYTVLAAANAGEALTICEQEGDRVDLVLTDVVMPRMSGRDLVERLARVWPGLKALFMSGYTDDAVVRHGVLNEGRFFIQKPYRPLDLAEKVRAVLDEGQ